MTTDRDIPAGDFMYRLVVSGVAVGQQLILRGPLRIGDLFPLAEGGGRVTKIRRLGDDGPYEIHVDPVV
jgi:hypothetical protein